MKLNPIIKKKIIYTLIRSTLLVGTTIGAMKYSETIYNAKIRQIERKHDNEIKEKNKQIENIKKEKKEVENDLKNLQEEIKLSKEYEEAHKYDYDNKDLTKFAIYTVDEMNEWIAERAPEDSPFIGEGETFLKASNESGLDPKYLVAHAALESSWGTSNIASVKSNYYGIGAYNSSPMSSSYEFDNSFEGGIIEGARWIKDNYTSKGKNTLNKMQSYSGAYCTLDDEKTPDDSWQRKIVNIVY